MKPPVENHQYNSHECQGNGDYPGVDSLIRDLGYVTPALQMDLQRLKQARVPVGLVFEQGADVLGLK